MTRINCIPANELTDKHLVAEYRELPRLAKHAKQKWERNPGFVPPGSYRMGKGHMDFFVDKGAWLAMRHRELTAEMKKRGFTVNYPIYPSDFHPTEWMNDWAPTTEAQEINRQRIQERLRG